jgi:hypothetical protein
MIDPANVPLSTFDDDDLHHMLTYARQHPDEDPQLLGELEAEYADRMAPAE